MSQQYRQPPAAVAPIRAPAEPPISSIPTVSAGFNDAQSFELTLRVAKMLSSSTLVPSDYRGQNGLANCAIALNMAQRIGADPLLVMQNLVVIHGRPTWSAQFLIATFNGCGRFSPIRYEFTGEEGTDGYGCRAIATEKATGEKIEGPLVTVALSKAEGWYGRNGSKWKTMPGMMLRYRAAAWLVRTTAPELSMGLQTVEEAHDIYDATPADDGSYVVAEAAEPTESVNIETGEIVDTAEAAEIVDPDPPAPPAPQLSEVVADWLADIDHMTTKAEIGAAANAVRKDESIEEDDRAVILDALKERQEVIKAGAADGVVV